MNIGFIGCGTLGDAILEDMLARRKVESSRLFVTDKFNDLSKYVRQGLAVCMSAKDVVTKSDVVLIAVKPQDMNVLLGEIKPYVNPTKLLISIAASLETTYFEEKLNKCRIIRVMPNLPLIVGELAGAFCLGHYTKAEDVSALDLFFGDVLLIEVDEHQMHAITALSGSGPAFISYIIDAFVKAAEHNGLERADALLLAEKTFLGTSKLLISSKDSPDSLIKKVASKGGTTEAGLEVLKSSELEQIISETIRAAVKRSIELSKESLKKG